MRKSGLLQVHFAVFLFGLAGLFGKFLSCSPVFIVLGRTLFASISLFIYSRIISHSRFGRTGRKRMFFLALQGVLLAVHWVTFFLSIQISSVAVGLVTFSSFPLFVTFMEPFWFNEPLEKRDVATALAVFAGILLVVPGLDLSNEITLGAFFGIFSGFTFAVLGLVNRKNAALADPIAVAFFQNLFASACLIFPAAVLPLTPPVWQDLPGLIFLGVFCTALAHTLFIGSLQTIRTQTASVIAGLEPVYGIVLAFFLLREIPAVRTVLGGVVIIGATLVAGFFSNRGQTSKG
ncbi:DMT family transporter [Desulfospira joergensenii]|uniref:DMT family transporter n=1 Tax=Desulfospira joergensenii TaxID=53329 RepID=UPI0003B688D0|nr:DMT family transporter [Desulfospira joergensenii]